MRTTLNLDDDLYQEVKRRAVQQGRTITVLVEEALRSSLRDADLAADAPPAFPVHDGAPVPGLLPGVDLDDSAALVGILDGDAAP